MLRKRGKTVPGFSGVALLLAIRRPFRSPRSRFPYHDTDRFLKRRRRAIEQELEGVCVSVFAVDDGHWSILSLNSSSAESASVLAYILQKLGGMYGCGSLCAKGRWEMNARQFDPPLYPILQKLNPPPLMATKLCVANSGPVNADKPIYTISSQQQQLKPPTQNPPPLPFDLWQRIGTSVTRI
nr:hypothetical protein Iba_chr07fCG3460 [Ipomoea batatas]